MPLGADLNCIQHFVLTLRERGISSGYAKRPRHIECLNQDECLSEELMNCSAFLLPCSRGVNGRGDFLKALTSMSVLSDYLFNPFFYAPRLCAYRQEENGNLF